MSCIICLSATDAHRVCSCSALACHRCLLSLLDQGKERRAQCGSRFQHREVARACRFGLELPVDEGTQLFVSAFVFRLCDCQSVFVFAVFRIIRLHDVPLLCPDNSLCPSSRCCSSHTCFVLRVVCVVRFGCMLCGGIVLTLPSASYCCDRCSLIDCILCRFQMPFSAGSSDYSF